MDAGRRWNTALCCAAAVSIAACGGGEPRGGAAPDADRVAYVDSRSCADCHRRQWDQWVGSHHDLAMQAATEETVLGDFDDAGFELFGVPTRFFRRDGRFFVNTEGPDGEAADFEIAYTFGVEPLQQYLVELDGGRIQCLTVAWDVERGRWYSLYPDERIAADDPLHWTGRYQRWNTMCADCHSTQLEKNYDPATDTYATSWHEIDVGCQACHGPGAEHLAWAGSPQAPAPERERDLAPRRLALGSLAPHADAPDAPEDARRDADQLDAGVVELAQHPPLFVRLHVHVALRP
jgi:hypothetical protein